jgi:hypothetical protein
MVFMGFKKIYYNITGFIVSYDSTLSSRTNVRDL